MLPRTRVVVSGIVDDLVRLLLLAAQLGLQHNFINVPLDCSSFFVFGVINFGWPHQGLVKRFAKPPVNLKGECNMRASWNVGLDFEVFDKRDQVDADDDVVVLLAAM